jgi:branched-chain amino acid transport system substrate-binding protein
MSTISRWRAFPSLVTVFVLLAAVALAACGGDDDDESQGSPAAASSIPKGPIVIGAAVAETGPYAPYDGGAVAGFEVGVDQINRAGGVDGHPIEVIYADTESDPAKGAAAMLKLIGQGAKIALISSDFDLGAPAATTAIEEGLLTISPGGSSSRFNPDVLGPLLFTMATAASGEGAIMADWGYQRKDVRKAYLMQDSGLAYTKDVCKGYSSALSKLDGTEVVGQDSFKTTDVNFSAQIANIKATRPDAIMLCALVPVAPIVVKQIRAAGIDIPILTSAGLDGNYWIKAVPNLSDLYYDTYGSVFGDDPRPEARQFFEAEAEHLGHPPVTAYDMVGHAAANAIKLAVERAGTLDGAALSKELESFKDEPLIVGPTTFTATSHLNGVRPMAIMQVQNGEFSFLELFPEP